MKKNSQYAVRVIPAECGDFFYIKKLHLYNLCLIIDELLFSRGRDECFGCAEENHQDTYDFEKVSQKDGSRGII